MALRMMIPDAALVGRPVILALRVTGATPDARVTLIVELDRGQGQRAPLSQSEVLAQPDGGADATVSVTPPFTDDAEGLLVATARAEDGAFLGVATGLLRVMA